MSAWIARPNGARRKVGPGIAGALMVVMFVAIAASAASVGVFVGSKQIVLALLGSIGLLACAALSGNQRLFCLWGLALTAPLGLSKAFFIQAHMGGASAVTIDAVDIFMLPLLIFLVRDIAQGRRERLRFPPALFWWGGLMLLGLVNLALGPYRSLAALEFVRMAKSALLFFVVVNEIVRRQQLMHFVTALAIGVVMQSAFALIQYSLKINLGLQVLGEPVAEATQSATASVYLGTSDIFRAGGLFSHPNLLAGYLALLMPICIALLFSSVKPLLKALMAVATALGMAALVVTLSRSGWMSFAAGFTLLFGLSMLHQKLRLRYVLVRLTVIGAVFGGVGLASGEIIRRITQSDPGALRFRFEMMDAAWRMIWAHPIFGLGLNTFVANFPIFAARPGPEAVTADYGATWPVVHNSYLITWTEQGTLGFLLLVGLYLSILGTGIRTARYSLDDRPYAINLGACCGIIAIMIDGIGSFFIDENAGQRVFWLVVGLIFAAHNWTGDERLRRARARAAPAGRVVGVA